MRLQIFFNNDTDLTAIFINCLNEAYDKAMEIYCAAQDVAFPLSTKKA